MKLDIKDLHCIAECDAIAHAESAEGLTVARLGYVVTYHHAKEQQGRVCWRVVNRHGKVEWFRDWPRVLFFLETPKQWRYI